MWVVNWNCGANSTKGEVEVISEPEGGEPPPNFKLFANVLRPPSYFAEHGRRHKEPTRNHISQTTIPMGTVRIQ
jgi:hypothetical protein